MSVNVGIKNHVIYVWKTFGYLFIVLLSLSNAFFLFHVFDHLLLDTLLHINLNALVNLHWSILTNTPLFMMGLFIILSGIGLIFRAKIAWGVNIILLCITTIYLWHFYPALTFNLYLGIMSIIVLIIFKRQFSKSSATAGTFFAIINFIALLFYSSYGALYFGVGFNPKIENLITAFYYSIETMTTVGYGDIVPVSPEARLFVVSVIVVGITIFATSLTSILGPLISGGLTNFIKGEKMKIERYNHFIICGLSTLAVSMLESLLVRGKQVTVIAPETDLEEELRHKYGNKLDIIRGDYTDDTILEKAGIYKAKAILALAEDDADNAFIALSVKELNADVRTVVIVNDSKNLGKIKKVQPDVVLSLQLFGSEILTRVLNNEKIDNAFLASMLFSSSKNIFLDDDAEADADKPA